MPFARVDMIRGNSAEFRQTVGDVVSQAMRETLGAPKGDRFQVTAEHASEDFAFNPGFLGIHRTPGCIFVRFTIAAGRTLDQKPGFYRCVADGLHTKLGVRREDVCISLVPVNADDWSFGNGEASLVKA